MEEHTDIKKSIDIIWEYHMQISLLYDDDDIFKMYCFPQNYEPYDEILKKSNDELSLDKKAEAVLNSVVNEYDENDENKKMMKIMMCN